MSLFTIYLFCILPSIGSYLTLVGTLTLILSVLVLSFVSGCYDSLKPLKHLYYIIPICLILNLIAILIPNEKQLYTIAGGYYTSNIEGIDKLPKNVVGVINHFLEQYQSKKGE